MFASKGLVASLVVVPGCAMKRDIAAKYHNGVRRTVMRRKSAYNMSNMQNEFANIKRKNSKIQNANVTARVNITKSFRHGNRLVKNKSFVAGKKPSSALNRVRGRRFSVSNSVMKKTRLLAKAAAEKSGARKDRRKQLLRKRVNIIRKTSNTVKYYKRQRVEKANIEIRKRVLNLEQQMSQRNEEKQKTQQQVEKLHDPKYLARHSDKKKAEYKVRVQKYLKRIEAEKQKVDETSSSIETRQTTKSAPLQNAGKLQTPQIKGWIKKAALPFKTEVGSFLPQLKKKGSQPKKKINRHYLHRIYKIQSQFNAKDI